MNKYQAITSGQGLMKDQADNRRDVPEQPEGENNVNPVMAALQRRASRLTDRIAIPTKDKLEGSEGD
jgi:hypothetical protein